jgi:CubicO group peptidase (beta-lactamase class C family)
VSTTLEVREGSGDFEHWQDAVTISAPQTVTFRWSTSEKDVTSAQWQVTDAADGFSQSSFRIIGSGVLTEVPGPPPHAYLFDIDFSPFLPVPTPTTAKHYYVRIVPLRERQKLEPSPSVKISCVPAGPPLTFGKGFDIDLFEQNLKSQLAQGTMGYSYAIFDHVNLVRAGAGGLAVSPNVPQSPDKRMTTMSMSKTITATAVMKLMEEMRSEGTDITVDSAIAPYLPSNWSPYGLNVSKMTFRHLLTHTSGLRAVSTPGDADPDTYTNLWRTIKAGANNADFGGPAYANANFCLFRIIIPYMAGTTGFLIALAVGDDNADAKSTGKAYVQYVKEHVLEPIGLGGIDVIPTGPQPYTRYYPDWSDSGESYGDPTDDTAMLRTGAGYWYMSATEFAKFIASLRNGLIVSADTFAIMKPDNWRVGQTTALGVGMYGKLSTHGRYWNHNGGLPASYADWMIFPNGITAVIMVNSGLWGDAPENVVENAFNTAYV